ncbi:branched-chain phosphotransacylase [Alkalibacterium iburiense]|uniref:Branched-chain phosphotransacylase n=1 Tax=Alkalibacterium iburiense TaxID=290589 RepID=A0ABN0X9B1_9LACT
MLTVAVAGGSRPELLELVQHARAELNEELVFKVFDTDSNIDDQGLWEYTPCQTEEESVQKTIACVVRKEADIILKGGVKTHTLLKEVLKKEHGLKNKELLSHVALVNLPALGRQILLTDSGMNIEPSEDQLESIIENVMEVGKKIGLTRPKIALLSAAENFNPKMPSSVMAQALTETFKDQKEAIVHGPLSLDLALSKEAVKQKRYEGPIEGDADILVVPSIDTGNALYKSFILFGQATMGGTIVGTKVPIVLTSRSDAVKSKLHALKFAIMQANQ